MFAERSECGGYMPDIERMVRDSDLVVLNGDVFDFRWSTIPSTSVTIARAVEWLEYLCSLSPRCTVAYVLGNHDALRPLTVELARLAESRERFCWYPTHARFGNALFLHGDTAVGGRHSPLDRRLRDTPTDTGATYRACYRLAIRMRLHVLVSRLLSDGGVCRGIWRSLRESGGTVLDGVDHVYFGHTHAPFAEHVHGGVRFHNTGSAIKRLEFRPMRFTFRDGEGRPR
jgi:UDP-2,3-diacylglucosamine hydrolase